VRAKILDVSSSRSYDVFPLARVDSRALATLLVHIVPVTRARARAVMVLRIFDRSAACTRPSEYIIDDLQSAARIQYRGGHVA